MRRLTTNKTVNDMSMIERAHNACYVKDCNARYRDYDMDIDARELARKLLVDLAEGDDAFTCDEDFDDWMCDYMSEGIDSMEGLIAVFYTNIWAMADLHERLKEYEDLEEQGKMLKLPCEIGHVVYRIYQFLGEGAWEIAEHEIRLEDLDNIGKTVFLTRREAENAIKELTN